MLGLSKEQLVTGGSIFGPTIVLLLGVLVLGPMMCATGPGDLDAWKSVSGGKGKLAAFVADPTREGQLRFHAAETLVKMGAYAELMDAVQGVDEQQRQFLLLGLARKVTDFLLKDHKPAHKKSFFLLGYYLLEHIDLISGTNKHGERRDQLLVETMLDWGLDVLKQGKAVDLGAYRLTDVLLAAAMKRPAYAVPILQPAMAGAPNLERFLAINHILSRLEDPTLRHQQAGALLSYAKKVYPKINPLLAKAMLENQNETLLRFLLDAARDYRVPVGTRQAGLEAAQNLKEKSLDGLFLVLQTDDPETLNIQRLNALDLIWNYGGTDLLQKALQTLPAGGTWWPKGVEFRAHVDEFCDEKLKPAKDDVRETLVGLVDDPNWVTRVYAMECIMRLYPDDAGRILTPLAKDDTVLKGWSPDGETTIGAAVAEFQKNGAQ